MTFIKQHIYSIVEQPVITWRQDILLDDPFLIDPRDGANLCTDAAFSSGAGSGVTLIWSQVEGAEFYIVQWCRNTSFSGPTVKTALVNDPGGVGGTVDYELNYGTDIILGAEYHWRVIAYNTTGGVSNTSVTRVFTFDCPDVEGNPENQGDSDGSGGDDSYDDFNACDNISAKIDIEGRDEVECCDEALYILKASWECGKNDQFRDQLTKIEWEIVDNPNVTFVGDPTDQEKARVSVNALESGEFTIKVTLTFRSQFSYYSPTECSAEKKVTIDCDSDRPWMRMCLYPHKGVLRYMDEEFVGSLRNEASGAGEQQEFLGADGMEVAWLAGPVFEQKSVHTPTPYPGTGGDPCEEEFVCIDRGMDTVFKHEARIPLPLGCGLYVHGGTVQIRSQDLIGEGLKFLREDCSIGLDYIYGCGLKLTEGSLELDLEQLAGPGLYIYDYCYLGVYLGCGLYLDDEEQIAIDVATLVGEGLKNARDDCKIALSYVACGINLDEDGSLYLDLDLLAGPGLFVHEGCSLGAYGGDYGGGYGYPPGCGLFIDDDGFMTVNPYELAGKGLYVFHESENECSLTVYPGCGLEFDEEDRLKIKAPDLVDGSDYLMANTSPDGSIDPGCAIDVCTELKEVVVDVYCSNGELYQTKEEIIILSPCFVS